MFIDRLNAQELLPTCNWKNRGNVAINHDTERSFRTYGIFGDRLIFVLIAAIGTTIQAIAHTVSVINKIFSTIICLLYINFSILDFSKTLLQATLILPISMITLPVVSIFGIFFPNNAKQIYRQLELLAFGEEFVSLIFNAETIRSRNEFGRQQEDCRERSYYEQDQNSELGHRPRSEASSFHQYVQ
jgi:hypothetical protein